MKNLMIKTFFLILLAAIGSLACAEYVVIVNPGNPSSISKDDVAHLYLAKTKSFPGGELAIPMNQPEAAGIREAFEKSVLGKSASQMKAYWSQLIFTGKAVPLKQADSDAEVVELVGKNPSAIGYVDKASVSDTVKVLFEF